MEPDDRGAPAEDPDEEPVEASAPEFSPAGFERWRRDSALGSVGTGIARGLQNVFGTPQDQVVMVAPVPGGPPDPDRLQVILDPDDPTKSVAVLPTRDTEDAGQTGTDGTDRTDGTDERGDADQPG
ncbi:MAG TPA: hypothetical protein VG346_07865 [Acidimicrobiales bacterium]|jgi:hypothetical protein|nr:hypothetical protein [Acidimicrobiales bacterium]